MGYLAPGAPAFPTNRADAGGRHATLAQFDDGFGVLPAESVVVTCRIRRVVVDIRLRVGHWQRRFARIGVTMFTAIATALQFNLAVARPLYPEPPSLEQNLIILAHTLLR
ncbi:MAG: hypothetical protein ACRYG8_25230 [Janthinobacterium lividum]